MNLLNLDPAEASASLVFPRARAASWIVRAVLGRGRILRGGVPVLLIHGPDGACAEGVAGISVADRLARFCRGHRRPAVVRVPSSLWLSGEPAPAAKLITLLLEKHPLLRSARMNPSMVFSLLNLAASHPLDAGRRLGRHLQREEQRRTRTGLTCGVRMIIQFEGIDRLFEGEGQSSSETDELRGFRDLLGFIHGLTGQRSVIFSLCGHSWVVDRLFRLARHAGIGEGSLLVYGVRFPERDEVFSLVSGLVESLASDIGFDKERPNLTDLTEAITEDLLLHPACSSLLPEILGRIREEAEILEKPLCLLDYTGIERLSGVIRERAERVFREQSNEDQHKSVLVLSKISKNASHYTDIECLIKNDSRLKQAFYWRVKGMLSLQLDPDGGKVFSPSHPDLFLKWDRAKRWRDEAFMEETYLDSGAQLPLCAEEGSVSGEGGRGKAITGRPIMIGLGIVALAMLLAIGFMAMVNALEEEGLVLEKPHGHSVEFRSTSSKIHPIVPTE